MADTMLYSADLPDSVAKGDGDTYARVGKSLRMLDLARSKVLNTNDKADSVCCKGVLMELIKKKNIFWN
jgi:hypothetical protein